MFLLMGWFMVAWYCDLDGVICVAVWRIFRQAHVTQDTC